MREKGHLNVFLVPVVIRRLGQFDETQQMAKEKAPRFSQDVSE